MKNVSIDYYRNKVQYKLVVTNTPQLLKAIYRGPAERETSVFRKKVKLDIYVNTIKEAARAERDARLKEFYNGFVTRYNLGIFRATHEQSVIKNRVVDDVAFIYNPDWSDLKSMFSVASRMHLCGATNVITMDEFIKRFRCTSYYTRLNNLSGLRDNGGAIASLSIMADVCLSIMADVWKSSGWDYYYKKRLMVHIGRCNETVDRAIDKAIGNVR